MIDPIVREFNSLVAKYGKVALERYNVLPWSVDFFLGVIGAFVELDLDEGLHQRDVAKYDDDGYGPAYFKYLMDEKQIIKTCDLSYKYLENSLLHRLHIAKMELNN